MEDSVCLFVDLQLDVKGCRDVYASFDKYVEVERLEGDNKYHAEQYGLQVDLIGRGVHFHVGFVCFLENIGKNSYFTWIIIIKSCFYFLCFV